MSPGVVIKDAIGDLVGGRVYANTFPQESASPTWPAVRFTVITETNFPDQCGSDDTATDDVSVQIDVVAQTYDAMRTLKANVITRMATATTPAVRQPGGGEEFDAPTKTHRAILEYLFQPSSAADSPA